jgi:hypothetical protein
MDSFQPASFNHDERRAMTMNSAAVPAPARPFRMRLAYRLIIVLVVKVILLALLWHTFIKPYKVKVDVDVMGSHIASTVSPVSIPIPLGDNK